MAGTMSSRRRLLDAATQARAGRARALVLASGVALFASGIMLAAYKIQIDRTALSLALLKNIVQPALVLVGLRSLGYGAPIVPEAVLTTAIPSMPIVIVLAVQYHVLEGRASSALFLSVIGSMFTIGVFIALTQ